MVSYEAFFDELEKIAASEAEDEKKYVTKKKLLRLAKVVGAAGAGAAVGAGAGYLGRRLLKAPKTESFFGRHPKMRAMLPVAAGALGAGSAMALATKDKKVKQYLEKDDEGKRSK